MAFFLQIYRMLAVFLGIRQKKTPSTARGYMGNNKLVYSTKRIVT